MPAAAEAAFLQLYDEHALRLHTYCLRLCANADDAADALQDTFTALLGRLRSGGEPIEHPGAYLYATARHACLRRLSERGRLEVVPEVPEHEPPAGPAGGEREVLTGELREEVRAAHDRLPARHREVLFLREVEGLPYAAIGDVMELTPNAAAQLAWRARAGLRTDLRHRALLAVAVSDGDCDRARTLLALREDGALAPADETWLDEHLARCERCRASRGLLLEAGSTYRAALPVAALPLTADEAFAHASDASAARARDGGRPDAPSRRRPGRGAAAGAATGLALFGMLLLAGPAEEPPPRSTASAAAPAGAPPAPERTFDRPRERATGGAGAPAPRARARTRAPADVGRGTDADARDRGEREGREPQPSRDAGPHAGTDVEARVPPPAPELLTPATGREPLAPVSTEPVASTAPPAQAAAPPPAPPAPAPLVALPPLAPAAPPSGPEAPACDTSGHHEGSSGPGSACEPCEERDEDEPGDDRGPPDRAALRDEPCERPGARPRRAPVRAAAAASRGR